MFHSSFFHRAGRGEASAQEKLPVFAFLPATLLILLAQDPVQGPCFKNLTNSGIIIRGAFCEIALE